MMTFQIVPGSVLYHVSFKNKGKTYSGLLNIAVTKAVKTEVILKIQQSPLKFAIFQLIPENIVLPRLQAKEF